MGQGQYLRLFFALLLMLASVHSSAGFNEGVEASRRGDFKTALNEWKPLAEQGEAAAQYNLGVLFAQGKGVPQDYHQAAMWAQKSAEQRYAPAQTVLGTMYLTGKGVPQDLYKAAFWYLSAADGGDASAQNTLGKMFQEGVGLEKDHVIAYALFTLSTANNSSTENNAQSNKKSLVKSMTSAQIEAGKALARKMDVKSNLAKALDQYLTAKKKTPTPTPNSKSRP